MISVAINVKVKQEDKRIVRIQALSEDGLKYKVRKEMCVAGQVVGTMELGDMIREPNETDLQFASKMLQKATEK
jgi:hypothetical protein